MSERPVLTPGPNHPITVEPASARARVYVGERLIAETDSALILREADYPPVPYLPLDAIDPAVLEASDHHTYCPYKGEASYYSLRTERGVAADAVWTYPAPYEAVSEIAGHVAFYPQHAQVELD